MDPQWSETGDRYLIKLFRDHVFHQVDESNRPILDISHVLTALNKVDVGVDEKIMLMSRDEQSCLIVRYKDIRACVDAAFSDLCKAALGDNSHAVAGSGGVPGTSGGSSVNLRSYS